jgi:hypothetical protein
MDGSRVQGNRDHGLTERHLEALLQAIAVAYNRHGGARRASI